MSEQIIEIAHPARLSVRDSQLAIEREGFLPFVTPVSGVNTRKRSKVPSGGSASPEKSIAAWMQELSELDVGGGGRLRRSVSVWSSPLASHWA